MHPRHRPALIMLLAAFIGTTALGQTSAVERDQRPIVQVTGVGTGEPIVLRWRPATGEAATVQISTRTVPTALERPDVDDVDPETVLTGFTRPPIEKLWTLQGRIARTQTSTDSATQVRWRIIDAVARIVGIKETRQPPSESAEDSDGPSPKPGGDERLESDVSSPETSDPEAVIRAVKLEGIVNTGLAGTKGAAITQSIGGSGFMPGTTTVRLETANRRAEFEAGVLRGAMEMVQLQVPSEPIGIGGTWTARWTRIQNDVPVTVVVDATLVSVDEEATAGARLARQASIKVEYRRRAIDPATEPRRKRLAEANGRGLVRLNLDSPLRLDARLVETPPGPPTPGVTRLATRIRASTVK